ncbi:MAG: hypothetical protein PQJ48_12700, partial [Sphaerochaetaceae bacterium]|nr:hypothetical protein [Sphaerochaetaceae bacterium]
YCSFILFCYFSLLYIINFYKIKQFNQLSSLVVVKTNLSSQKMKEGCGCSPNGILQNKRTPESFTVGIIASKRCFMGIPKSRVLSIIDD